MAKEEIGREIDEGMAESGSINRGSFAKYTKQEEIESKRAGIDGWLKGYLFEIVSFANRERSLHMVSASWYDRELKRIKKALQELSVVIKVDRELPSVFDSNEDCISALEYRKKLAGYVATEPLIEEE